MSKKQTHSNPQKSPHHQRKPGHSRAWWLKHYQAWQKSGLSKTKYCTQQDLNLSTFVNWTTRFEQDIPEDKPDKPLQPAFFKAVPHSKPSQGGMVHSLTLRDLSVTFDQPIDSEALSGWIEVLKRC